MSDVRIAGRGKEVRIAGNNDDVRIAGRGKEVRIVRKGFGNREFRERDVKGSKYPSPETVSMFDDTVKITEIIKFGLAYSSGHEAHLVRNFEADISDDDLNVITKLNEEFATDISPSVLTAGGVGGMLRASGKHRSIATILDRKFNDKKSRTRDWHDGRYRFFLLAETYSEVDDTERTLTLLQGFTEDDDIAFKERDGTYVLNTAYNGDLYINSITTISQTYDHRGKFYKNTLEGNINIFKKSDNSENYSLGRPHDVLKRMGRKNNGDSNFLGRSTMTNDRGNNTGSKHMGRMLRGHIRNMVNSTSTPEYMNELSVYQASAMETADDGPALSPLLKRLHKIIGKESSSSTFDLRSLIDACPETLTANKLEELTYVEGPVPELRNIEESEFFDELNSDDVAPHDYGGVRGVLASEIATSFTEALSSAKLLKAEVRISNDPVFVDYEWDVDLDRTEDNLFIDVQGVIPMIDDDDGRDTIKAHHTFKSIIRDQYFKNLTRNYRKKISITASISFFGDHRILVATVNKEPILYGFGAYADSSYSPVLSTDGNVKSLANKTESMFNKTIKFL